MGINVIDPHKAFGDGNTPIPDINNLTIIAELTATRKKRTVVTKTLGGEKVTSDGESTTVHFLGFDEKTNSFTTNWSDSNNDGSENFGITNIDININASYVPQVNITFIDVRGRALFQQGKESKYAAIFDFPPPIFKLKVKGYYGMTIEYLLHLTKINSRFNASTGNFEITGNFIGLTFAPLADVKFGYLKVAPFLSSGQNQDTNKINTYELLLRAKSLPDTVKKVLSNDIDILNGLTQQINDLVDFKNTLSKEEILKSLSTVTNIQNNLNGTQDKFTIDIDCGINAKLGVLGTSQYEKDYNEVKTYIDDKNKIKNNDLHFEGVNSFTILNFSTIKTDNLYKTNIATIDTVELFRKIDERISEKQKEINNKRTSAVQNASKAVNDIIGFTPTINKVFDILLSDADTFVNELRNTSNRAQNTNRNVGTSGDDGKFAWPLYVATQNNNNSQALNKEVKMIPPDPNWEEVRFVNNYINATFNQAKAVEDLEKQFSIDSEGNYEWYPINILDSPIYNQTNPYFNNNNVNNIFEILVKRALVSVNYSYLDTDNEDLFKSLGKLEAYNIAGGIVSGTNDKVISELKQRSSETFGTLANTIPFIKSVDNNDTITTISGATPNIIYGIDNKNLIATKTIKDFGGITSFNNSGGDTPHERNDITSNDDLGDAIKKVIDEFDGNWFKNLFFNSATLSQYNTLFWKDVDNDGDNSDSDFTNNIDEAIDFIKRVQKTGGNNDSVTTTIDTPNYTLNVVTNATISPDTFLLYMNGKVSFDETTSSLGILPLNRLNDKLENNSILEIPLITLAWYGYQSYLVDDMDVNGNFTTTLIEGNPIYSWIDKANPIANTSQKVFNSVSFNGDFDIINNIPQSTREELKKHYRDYVEIFRKEVATVLVNDVIANKYFNKGGTAEGGWKTVGNSLMEKRYLILSTNISKLTSPTAQLNFNIEERKNLVESFVNTAISELSRSMSIKKRDKDKQFNDLKSKIENKDLKTDLYYAFKSFNDRWLTGDVGIFNSPLIDKFRFVDRAFNPIGDDAILDLSPLLDADADTPLYTILLNLLTKNGFEFFPLQNFMLFEGNGVGAKDGWTNENIKYLFGTSLDYSVATESRFICMYIGGNATKLDISYGNSNPDFKPDGCDLLTDCPPDIQNSNQVKAFKLEFGTENQSFFKSINLDTVEFKETNESIKILDKIAKSGEEPTAIGQNLFNTYEQRSYTCQVEMMGNVMIQPTMYFNLENIPMFKGAYIILEVTHSIQPNTINTSFKGVKIAKFPKPIVKDYSAFLGYDLSLPSDGVTNNQTNNTVVNVGGIDKSNYRPFIDVSVTSSFGNPLSGGVITSVVGNRVLNGNLQSHPGTDIAVKTGNDVFSAEDGVVIQSKFDAPGFGNYVVIRHNKSTDGNYYYTVYGHLSERLVSVGNTVKKGQVIGKSGNTGAQTTGEHLHYEVYQSDKFLTEYAGNGSVKSIAKLLDGTMFMTGLGDKFTYKNKQKEQDSNVA